MDNRQLREEIREIVVEAVGLDDIGPQDIEFDAPLFEDPLGLDSIDALEIAVLLEKRFKVQIKPDEATKDWFYSVTSLASKIQELRSASA